MFVCEDMCLCVYKDLCVKMCVFVCEDVCVCVKMCLCVEYVHVCV